MVKSLDLSAFIRSSSFVPVEEGLNDVRTDPNFVDRFKKKYGSNITLDMSRENTPRNILIKFIITQLPNIKPAADQPSLKDLVDKNSGDFGRTIRMSTSKHWVYILFKQVEEFLRKQLPEDTSELLKPFGGNITQLLDAIAQEVTEKLRQGY